jgi:hypothetical protein
VLLRRLLLRVVLVRVRRLVRRMLLIRRLVRLVVRRRRRVRVRRRVRRIGRRRRRAPRHARLRGLTVRRPAGRSRYHSRSRSRWSAGIPAAIRGARIHIHIFGRVAIKARRERHTVQLARAHRLDRDLGLVDARQIDETEKGAGPLAAHDQRARDGAALGEDGVQVLGGRRLAQVLHEDWQ